MNALVSSWTPSTSSLFLWVFLNKVFSLQLRPDMLILNLKTAKHSKHIPLSAKSWYQLLTTALFILRNLETINKPFMW